MWLLQSLVLASAVRAGRSGQSLADLLASVTDAALVVDTSVLAYPKLFEASAAYPTEHKLRTLAPWDPRGYHKAKVYRSEQASSFFDAALAKPAPGLNGQSFAEVFTEMRKGLCIPYVLGGMVRDSLTGRQGLDVDITFTCPAPVLAHIAAKCDWHCSTDLGEYAFLGDESKGSDDFIEGYPAHVALSEPGVLHEYACNSLFYDPHNQVLIDQFGGLEDNEHKVIRIIGGQETWDEWAEVDPIKLVRYFKLRAAPKSYQGEEHTRTFVLGQIRRRWEEGTMEQLFSQQFQYFTHGSRSKLEALLQVVREDMGEEWFWDNLQPLFPDIVQLVPGLAHKDAPAYLKPPRAPFPKQGLLAESHTLPEALKIDYAAHSIQAGKPLEEEPEPEPLVSAIVELALEVDTRAELVRKP